MKRTFSRITLFYVASCLAVGAAFSLSLAGCAPPKAGSPAETTRRLPRDEGRRIIPAQPKPREPFRTVIQGNEELLEARGPVGRFGGTFYENQIGDGPKTFNPWAATDATSSALGDAMLPGLVTTDAYTGDVTPYLAKEVKLADDKRTYTVTLRRGLQWSDGKPITAADVVFTWNEIIRPGYGNASMRDVVTVNGQFPAVKALDAHTVQFRTAKPFAPFLRNLGMPIAPLHVMKPVVAKGNNAFAAFWGVQEAASQPRKFVSSGMWLLDSYEPRQRVVFKRNPHFFMVDHAGKRLPYLERYVIRFVGDLNNQQLQFEQGNADVYSVPGNAVSRVRKLSKPAFKMYNLGPSSGTLFLAINLNTRKDEQGKPLVDPVKSAWFNDVNFRQAVNHAINRDDIVANILKGVGAPLYTAESLSSIHLDQALAKGFPADLDDARQRLSESGFTWDKQGQLHDKAGHRVEFTLYTNSGNTEREATGVNIKQDLAALGMKVNFKPIDFNVLGDRLRQSDWETMIIGLTGSNLEPHGGANIWKSDGFLHLFNQRVVRPGKPTNLSDILPWEKELDRAFDEGAQLFDPDQRKAVYNRYQQIVYDQAPLIYLYSPLQIVAVRERVQNVDPTPLGGVTHNMEELWIDPAAEK
jgi:peptide/nickel transport system substrate-binding protein